MKKVTNKKACTATTNGTIKDICVGRDAKRLTIEYIVDDIVYTIKENVMPKSVTKKIGFISIGQENQWPIAGDVGDIVVVYYNPSNPKKAFLKDNIEN